MSFRGILAWLTVGIALLVAVYWLEIFAPEASRGAPWLELPELPLTVRLAIGAYLLAAFAFAAFLASRRGPPAAPPRRPALKWIATAFGATVIGGQATLVFAGSWAAVFLLPAAILPTLAVMAYILRRLGALVNWRLLSVAFVAGTFLAPLVALVLTPLVMLSLVLAQGTPQAALLTALAPMIVLYSIATPLAEEAAKQVGVVMLRHRLRRVSDAFLVGAATGAGFAIVEDLLFISLDLHPVDWPATVAMRALSHLIHPLLAGLISIQVYTTTQNPIAARDRLLRSYLIAVMLHGLWNLPWVVIFQLRPIWDPLGGYLSREQADLGANLLLALVTALLFLPLVLAMWKVLAVALEQLKLPMYRTLDEERGALFQTSRWRLVSRLTTFVARQTRLAAISDRQPAARAPEPLTESAATETPVNAGFGRRLAAWILDLLLVSALPIGLAAYLPAARPADVPGWLPIPVLAVAIVGFLVISLIGRRSPGKALLRLRLVDHRGRLIGRGRLLAREVLAKPLSAVWLLLGFLWTAWDEDRQGWHDLLAGTNVVRMRRGDPVLSTPHPKPILP